MPLPLTVSCFSEIQIGFTFLVPAHLGSPGKGPLNGVCVCNISRHFWPHGGYTILVFLHQFNGCFLGEPGSASFSFDCLLSVVLERTFEYEWQFFQLRQCQQSTAGYFETLKHGLHPGVTRRCNQLLIYLFLTKDIMLLILLSNTDATFLTHLGRISGLSLLKCLLNVGGV